MTRQQKYKIIHLLSHITICLAFLFMGLMFYWSFVPYNPFIFKTELSPVLNEGNKVKAGGTLIVETDILHNTDGVKVDLSTQIVNGEIITLTESSYITKKGMDKFVKSYQIPKFLAPGVYYIKIYNTVYINPIRKLYIIRETERFEIIK